MLPCSFFIESSSKLLVTRTGIKAHTSWFRAGSDYSLWPYLPLNNENFTLSNLNIWCQLANLDQILCVASLGLGKGCIMFEADWIKTGVHGNRKPSLTFNRENGVFTFSRLFLIRSFLYLQVTRTCIKSQTSSNFGQIRPLTTELAALSM